MIEFLIALLFLMIIYATVKYAIAGIGYVFWFIVKIIATLADKVVSIFKR